MRCYALGKSCPRKDITNRWRVSHVAMTFRRSELIRRRIQKEMRLPLLQRKVSLRLLEKIKDFHSAPLALLALASYEFFEHHMHAN